MSGVHWFNPLSCNLGCRILFQRRPACFNPKANSSTAARSHQRTALQNLQVPLNSLTYALISSCKYPGDPLFGLHVDVRHIAMTCRYVPSPIGRQNQLEGRKLQVVINSKHLFVTANDQPSLVSLNVSICVGPRLVHPFVV